MSNETIRDIAEKGVKCHIMARIKLLVPGQNQEDIYFLKSGIVRNYHKSESKEWTSRFSQAGDFVLSVDNFLFNLPCNEFIESCTPIEVIKFSKKDYAELLSHHPELHIVAHNIADERLRLSINRMYSLRMLSAAERYHQFVKEYPNLYKQVQLQHIASYLDISQYSLSRIRKQCKKAFHD